MQDLFRLLFGPDGRTVNRDAEGWIIEDDGEQHIGACWTEAVGLSGDDSIDRARFSGFFHCGCSTVAAALGGRCAEPGCRDVSCQRCHGVCAGLDCQKPLCVPHSRRLTVDGVTIRYCRECYGSNRRRQLVRQAFRALFSPRSPRGLK